MERLPSHWVCLYYWSLCILSMFNHIDSIYINIFRILVNLTNSPEWCNAILQSEFLPTVIRWIIHSFNIWHQNWIYSEDADAKLSRHHATVFDCMCLNMALLTNLVQFTPKTKSKLQEIGMALLANLLAPFS